MNENTMGYYTHMKYGKKVLEAANKGSVLTRDREGLKHV
jgi:hypothetical protein